MVAHRDILYIYGGVLGNSFFHDIYSFDLETKNWCLISMQNHMQKQCHMPNGRSFLAAVVQNDFLYVYGGNGDQNARSNELHRFKLPNQPKSTLKDDFFKLLKKELFCDLRFICSQNEIVEAHCAIVVSRSIYCRQLIKLAKEKLAPKQVEIKMLLPPFYLLPEEPIVIRIENQTAEAVRIVLEFLYTDKIVSLEGKETELDTLKLLVNVYKLANQFLIPKLKKICENLIVLSLNITNVLSLLQYIHLLNLSTLKEFCMKFLIKDTNFNQIIMLTEFEHFDKCLIVEAIRLKQCPRKILDAEFVPTEKWNSLEEDMDTFLNKETGAEFADIFIYLSEASAPILSHRCVLAARCAYFEAFFRSFMPKERKIMLTIGDTVPPHQACVALLRYIYYDEVFMLPEDSLYLFSANHYFQFSNLRLHVYCKQNLEANVSKANVFDILEAADKIQEQDMKQFALKMVAANFAELAHSHRIEKLPNNLLIDIMRFLTANNLNINTYSPFNQKKLFNHFSS